MICMTQNVNMHIKKNIFWLSDYWVVEEGKKHMDWAKNKSWDEEENKTGNFESVFFSDYKVNTTEKDFRATCKG